VDERCVKVLVAASDRMEFSGIPNAAPIASGLQNIKWCRTARAGENEMMLVANGVGVRRAAAATEAGIAAFRPDAVASTGFCGALSLSLAIADIVVASEVIGDERSFAAAPIACGQRYQNGVVLTHPRIVRTPEERSTLAARGAIAVEMEAAGVAECALRHSLPFYCVKTVTDLAGETLANDFNKALREDGHFDTIDLLTGTLRDPLVRIPELLRLQRRCGLAARALGAFFADCRF
jgi:adenosylhomocysteine nucleosidase